MQARAPIKRVRMAATAALLGGALTLTVHALPAVADAPQPALGSGHTASRRGSNNSVVAPPAVGRTRIRGPQSISVHAASAALPKLPGLTPAARPAVIDGWTGDGSQVIGGADGNPLPNQQGSGFGHVRWSLWTHRRAAGHGVVWANDCEPSCDDGHWHKYPTAVRAYRPRHGAFTRLSFRCTLGGPRHRCTFYYTGRYPPEWALLSDARTLVPCTAFDPSLGQYGADVFRLRYKPRRCVEYVHNIPDHAHEAYLVKIRWHRWAAKRANATATLRYCGMGTCTNRPARLLAYRRRLACGKYVYTRMRMSLPRHAGYSKLRRVFRLPGCGGPFSYI